MIDFDLVLQQSTPLTDAQIDALYEAGASEGTIVQVNGEIRVMFSHDNEHQSEDAQGYLRERIVSLKASGFQVDQRRFPRDATSPGADQRPGVVKSERTTVSRED